jgi:hypothetical protein
MQKALSEVNHYKYAEGVLKRSSQWYSKCYCVASVTKTFTPYICIHVFMYVYADRSGRPV